MANSRSEQELGFIKFLSNDKFASDRISGFGTLKEVQDLRDGAQQFAFTGLVEICDKEIKERQNSIAQLQSLQEPLNQLIESLNKLRQDHDEIALVVKSEELLNGLKGSSN